MPLTLHKLRLLLETYQHGDHPFPDDTPESGVPARRQIPQPSRLEKSGLLNQKEGKETWFEVT